MQVTNQTHCLLKSATIAIMDLVIQNTCTRMKKKMFTLHKVLKIFLQEQVYLYIGNKYTTYQQQAPPRLPDNEIVNAPPFRANSGFMCQ